MKLSTVNETGGISHCFRSNFTSLNDRNLVAIRDFGFTVYKYSQGVFLRLFDVAVASKILFASKFAPFPNSKEHILILSGKLDCFSISFNKKNNSIDSALICNLKDKCNEKRITRPVLGAIDPTSSFLILRVYRSKLIMVSLFPSPSNKPNRKESIIDSDDILSIDFYNSHKKPIFAVLFRKDNASGDSANYIRFYRINRSNFTLNEDSPSISVAKGSTMALTSKPNNSILVLHDCFVSLYSKTGRLESSQLCTDSPVTLIARLTDFGTFLINGKNGRIMSVALSVNHKKVQIHVNLIGSYENVDCISHLENNVVFFGSLKGESRLVSLGGENNVIESLNNFGSISDFENTNSNEILVISENGEKSSLSIIEKENYSLKNVTKLPFEIETVWSFKIKKRDFLLAKGIDKRIDLFSLEKNCEMNRIEKSELNEIFNDPKEISNLFENEKVIVLTTDFEIRMVSKDSFEIVSFILFNEDEEILIVKFDNFNNIVLLNSKNEIITIKIEKTLKIKSKTRKTLRKTAEISDFAVALNHLIVVYFNTKKVDFFSLNDLSNPVHSFPLNTDDIASHKSVHFNSFQRQNVRTLFVSTHKGDLFHFAFEIGNSLSESKFQIGNPTRKPLKFWNGPLRFSRLNFGSSECLLVSSDCSLVFSLNGRKELQFKRLNQNALQNESIESIANFASKTLFSAGNSIFAAEIENNDNDAEINKNKGEIGSKFRLKMRKLCVLKDFTSRSIVSAGSNLVFITGIGLKRRAIENDSKAKGSVSRAILMRYKTKEIKDILDFEGFGEAVRDSVYDSRRKLVFFGAFRIESERELKGNSKIFIAKVSKGKIDVLNGLKIKGVVWGIKAIDDKLFVSINSKIAMFKINENAISLRPDLTLLDSLGVNVISNCFDVTKKSVLLGQMMFSVDLVNHSGKRLEKVAEDDSLVGVTAVAFVGDDFMAVATCEMEIKVYKRDLGYNKNGQIGCLKECSKMKICGIVNRLMVLDNDKKYWRILIGLENGSVSVLSLEKTSAERSIKRVKENE